MRLPPLFTAAGVETAYRKLRAVWRSQHAESRLHTEIRPGLGHVFASCAQDDAFTRLDAWAGRQRIRSGTLRAPR